MASRDLEVDVKRLFSARLPRVVPGWHTRPGQLEMALAVADTLTGGGSLLAEAGTGTGKTMGYLGPLALWALRTGGRVMVSTATVALQEQLLRRDLPLLRRALGAKLRFAPAKGRGNYLCLLKLADEAALAHLAGHSRDELEKLMLWAAKTKTGDKSELSWVSAYWPDVAADAACVDERCPHAERCFWLRARGMVDQSVQIVVTNHALLVLDADARARGVPGVLPDRAVLVVDEGHELEPAAQRVLAAELDSRWMTRTAVRLRRLPGSGRPMFSRALAEAERTWEALFAAIETRFPLPGTVPLQEPDMRALGRIAEESARALDEVVEAAPENAATGYLTRAASHLRMVFVGRAEGWMRWTRRESGGGVVVWAIPTDAGRVAGEVLRAQPSVVTSATLATAGSFCAVRSALALPAEIREAVFQSPFDYASRAALYVPQDMPLPDDPEYDDAVAAEIRRILERTHGRALCLFTSYRGLDAAWRRLSVNLPWRLLRQGEAGRAWLLAEFRRDVSSVLLATQSFWSGVDVPGNALRCVIIDRLPFPPPDDPWAMARAQAALRRGGSVFRDVWLPEAAVRLRQGFGRLIRAASDSGIVAVLDRRIADFPYASVLLGSLPPVPLHRRLEDISESLLAPEADNGTSTAMSKVDATLGAAARTCQALTATCTHPACPGIRVRGRRIAYRFKRREMSCRVCGAPRGTCRNPVKAEHLWCTRHMPPIMAAAARSRTWS